MAFDRFIDVAEAVRALPNFDEGMAERLDALQFAEDNNRLEGQPSPANELSNDYAYITGEITLEQWEAQIDAWNDELVSESIPA